VFRQYDRQGEGRILVTDVPAAMLALGHNPTEKELKEVIASVPREGTLGDLGWPYLLVNTDFKDARSVSSYPYNQSQILQYVKYTK